MPLHLRIDRELDTQLRRRAAAEHIPTSALVRRLLRQAVHEHSLGGPTAAEVEDIARTMHRYSAMG
ncbi:MAG: ribbon-helix-helix protein, CopG family [Actinomycetota bacterium]|nr:ribbon-helix-helix protein, CopG family [Actinomycetota bacterium]